MRTASCRWIEVVSAMLLGLSLIAQTSAATSPSAEAKAATPAATAPLVASALETGLPLLRTFSPKDYGANTQNWAIVQDARGVIYVGNSDGVLEFDGQRWRLIKVANGTTVRSLALDAQGRVYVGAVGEIGYLAPDASGQMGYVSLLERVPVEARNFADVWNTYVTPQGVVFSSYQRLLRLHGDQFESWTPAAAFQFAFQVGDRVFIREPGRGLLELLAGQLRPLPGGERFADEKIFAMLPGEAASQTAVPQTAPASILIGTLSQGFFMLGPKGGTAWPTDIDAELKRDRLFTATRLPDGRLALGTLQGGMYLIDAQGRRLGHLDKANGLPDDTIYALSPDRDGGLWIATDNGLARAEVGSPLSRFDERSGLAGTTYAVHRHQGQLYAATAQGLYRLQPGPTARFERVPGIDGQTFALLTVGEQLLVANLQGVYAVAGASATLIKAFDAAGWLHGSQAQPGRVFVALRAGLSALRRIEGRWLDEGPLPGIDDEVRTILEDHQGGLWLGTQATGVIRVHWPAAAGKDTLAPMQIERFGVDEGLPSLNGNGVYLFAGEPRFATEAGIYRFDEALQRFEADPRFAGLFAQPRSVYGLLDDPVRGIWLYSENKTSGLKETGLVARQADGRFRWDSRPLRALRDYATWAIHRDPDGVAWFGGNEGLFRYDSSIAKIYTQPFPALLRRVSTRTDRVLFGGGGEPAATSLAYAENALRLNYAAPSFDGLEALRFQVRLDGSDSDWSDLSTENYKDYNNLFEGDYRFRVRAQNLYGTVSEEAVYAFTVLPPWYRTVWAYLAYVLALLGSGWGGLRWRLRQLRAQKRALEATVAERTRQLAGLGEVGREITATLNLDTALDALYTQINRMLDASVFGIGIYHPERGEIEIRLAIENGQRYQPYSRPMDNKNQLAVWCIEQRQPILIGDYPNEYARYIAIPDQTPGTLEDGSASRQPLSLLYVPILLKDAPIGVLTVQSFAANAYQQSDLELLQTLASYAAVAIDNARSHADLQASRRHLIDTQQQLVQQEKMAALGTLTAGVAHEINNPTNFADVAVQNLVIEHQRLHDVLNELAEDAGPEILQMFQQRFDVLSEMTAIAREGHRRIKAIVLDLRSFTRLDEADRMIVPIAEPIESTVHLIRTKFERVEFVLELEFNPPIECQPAKLGQLFMNLIANACEAIAACTDERTGRVRIATAQRSSGSAPMLEIVIEDNGCGMDAATKDKVFVPFFTTKAVGAGTGLGLAIVFGIVKDHGGRIEVESTPGSGSRFIVLLPLPA